MSITKKSLRFALQALGIIFISSLLVILFSTAANKPNSTNLVYVILYSPIYYLVLVFYFLILQSIVNGLGIKQNVWTKSSISSMLFMLIYLINFFAAATVDTTFSIVALLAFFFCGVLVGIPYSLPSFTNSARK
jgi:hypothetical protein